MPHPAQAGAGLSGRIASFMGIPGRNITFCFLSLYFPLHPLEAPKDSEYVIYCLLPSIECSAWDIVDIMGESI